MPLIVGGAVVGVLVLIGGIFALSGGSGGSGGSGAARTAALAYLAAWKSHEVDRLIEMEHLSDSDAEQLCEDYRRKVESSGNTKRIPTKSRGKLPVHTAVLGEMQELDFGMSDKQALLRKMLGIAYGMYFSENQPKISYELKRIEVDGQTATATVACSVQIDKTEPPELVLLTGIAASGSVSLVRVGDTWKIRR